MEATRAPILGWEVRPDMESTATSTTSAPASAQANMAATPVMEQKDWMNEWMDGVLDQKSAL